jgi:hypothetical protein
MCTAPDTVGSEHPSGTLHADTATLEHPDRQNTPRNRAPRGCEINRRQLHTVREEHPGHSVRTVAAKRSAKTKDPRKMRLITCRCKTPPENAYDTPPLHNTPGKCVYHTRGRETPREHAYITPAG